jgi:hypothetical protein
MIVVMSIGIQLQGENRKCIFSFGFSSEGTGQVMKKAAIGISYFFISKAMRYICHLGYSLPHT